MNSPKQECQLVKLHLRYQDRNIGAQSNSTVTEKKYECYREGSIIIDKELEYF